MRITPDLDGGRSHVYEISTTQEDDWLLDRSCDSRSQLVGKAVLAGQKDCWRAALLRLPLGEHFRCGLTAIEVNEPSLSGESTTVVSCHNEVCVGTGEQGSMPQVKNVAGIVGVMLCSRLREAAELDPSLS